MRYEHTENRPNPEQTTPKRAYRAPQLVVYGTVRDLTQSGTSPKTEGAPGIGGSCHNTSGNDKPCASERRVKENIVRVGTHPLGIGLYWFDYRPEFREAWGQGRQFGVLVEEVETAQPEAVALHADGYRRVDYAMLGISRQTH